MDYDNSNMHYINLFLCLSPVIPAEIIWILVINRAIPINMPAIASPIPGYATITTARIIDSIPTPIPKYFDHLLLRSSLIP